VKKIAFSGYIVSQVSLVGGGIRKRRAFLYDYSGELVTVLYGVKSIIIEALSAKVDLQAGEIKLSALQGGFRVEYSEPDGVLFIKSA